MKTRELARIALFPALIAILAQIAVPLPFSPVPLTGQFVGIFLAPAILGARGAVLAVSSYLLLGAAGAPIFSMAKGGLGVILGPTGGYLLGFLPGVYLAGKILGNRRSSGMGRTSLAMAACMIATYLVGSLQLKLVMGLPYTQAVLVGVLPYLPLDLAKIAFTAALSIRLNARLTTADRGGDRAC